MAQSIPSTLLYAQAVELISQLKSEYAKGTFKSPDEVSSIIKEILSRFDTGAGKPLTEFEMLQKGEPPHSEKMNRFWTNLQSDVNILQDQVDVLRASTIFTHNFVKSEILKEQGANARLQNKLKTLQLYSQTNDPSLIKFGDSFINDEFIDWNIVDESQRAKLFSNGNIGLGTVDQTNNLLKSATIRILPSSNGFLGNNQEIQDPLSATSNPVSKEKIYRFIAEENRAAKTSSVIDNEPNTWIEYENYLISDLDRLSAGNLNFTYKVSEQTTNVVGIEINNSGVVDWAQGPTGGVLTLEMEIDLTKSQPINILTFTPFGLTDNKNNPIRISSVSISETGTEWESLTPKNVWVINSIDKQISELNDEVVTVGSATWMVNGVYTRYIRIKVEQPKPIDVNVGHLYYIQSTNTPDAVEQRVLGPIPPLEDPAFYYSERNQVVNGLIQKREYFKGKRWAIGIRDIDLKSNKYSATSTFISKAFNIPGMVDRVALEASISVPSTFSQNTPWIKFWVSPNDGANWYQISRVQDDFLGIPEILAFNDPTPVPLREPGVGYIDLPNEDIKSLRLKVEFERPADSTTSTPILKSYTLKVKRR